MATAVDVEGVWTLRFKFRLNTTYTAGHIGRTVKTVPVQAFQGGVQTEKNVLDA